MIYRSMSLLFLSLTLWVGLPSCKFEAGERGSSAPFISGDTFRSHANHIFDETTSDLDPAKVAFGDIIFVKTDWEYLEAFFTHYHPQIQQPYILLTHNSDHGVPGPFSHYLDDPKLIGWFAQNVEGYQHPKLHPIPIGLANRCWTHGNPEVFSALLPLGANRERPILCYLNFQSATYPLERPYVWELFASQPWCVACAPVKELAAYLQDFSQSKFVLSPRGNGLDCHRTWEALLMGAIPVVRRSSLDAMYEELPVLIIDDWNTLTEAYLNEQYELLKVKTFNFEKLFINYWLAQMRAEVESCKN